jgi:hypothetical protein
MASIAAQLGRLAAMMKAGVAPVPPAVLDNAVNPTFSLRDLPPAPLGHRTAQQRGLWQRNAMLTHAYKNLQGIDADPATGVVARPYKLDADQMRGLSHYMYPRMGEQYRLNQLQQGGQPSPYADRFEYNNAMKGFLSTRAPNRQAVMDRANKMYPGANIANIPQNTLTNLQGIGQRSLQPPSGTSP